MSANVQANSSVLSGRYAVYGEIAAGGMASVLYGRLIGPVGFARPVAIKRLHPHIAREPAVVSMFIDEARICARVSHANVVPILDVIEAPGELALVMEYVHGCTLETLLDLSRERGELIPLAIAGALTLGVLHGLEAAHNACNEQGEPLHIVHRDVSPQNIMVAVDGVPRLFDFGIAKARGRLRSTPSGEVKGKLSYMAPEQLGAGAMDARVDVYASAVVLWELLTGRMLFDGEHESTIVHDVLYAPIAGPKSLRAQVSDELDALVLRGLSRAPDARFATVREMARALERALPPASQAEVSEWLHACAGERLKARAEWLKELQRAAEQGTPLQQPGGERLPRMPFPVTPDNLRSASFMRKKPRAWVLWCAFAAALIVLALIALWPEHTEPRASEAARTAGETAPARHGEQPAARAPAEAVAPVQASEDWSATPPSALEQPEAGTTKAAGHTSAVRREKKPAATKSKTPDCSEPYVIDALGVKRWKRECL